MKWIREDCKCCWIVEYESTDVMARVSKNDNGSWTSRVFAQAVEGLDCMEEAKKTCLRLIEKHALRGGE